MVQSATVTGEVDNMKCIYKSAQLIRQAKNNFSKAGKSQGNITVSSTLDDVQAELYTHIHWIIVGPAQELEIEVRKNRVHRDALTISQNIMYSFKSKRQVNYQPKRECADFCLQQSKENPQVLGLALTLHHDTRNKKLVNLLNAQNLFIPYSRVLFLETALANAVVENTKKFEGLFIPPFLKKGTFVFFAVDNTDFTEDTADGKCTTHGTITVIYQKAEAPGESLCPPLHINDAQSLTDPPITLLYCHATSPNINLQKTQGEKIRYKQKRCG